jgi:hypothetical protein
VGALMVSVVGALTVMVELRGGVRDARISAGA